MTSHDLPHRVDPDTVQCGDTRITVDSDGRYLAFSASRWDATRDSDPAWTSYWSFWPDDLVRNSGTAAKHHPGRHLSGSLAPGSVLVSIRVQEGITSTWQAAPFAVARGLIWLAHAPRWVVRAVIETSDGAREVTWNHRRFADYNHDLPPGVTEVSPPG